MISSQNSNASQVSPLILTERAHCGKHGEYEARALSVIEGLQTVWSRCPDCEAIRLADLEAQESRRVRQEAEIALRARIGSIGIPARFADRTLDSYTADTAGQRDALDAALAMADGDDPGMSLIFCGAPGTGKSHLACGIARRFAERGRTAVFRTVLSAVRHIKDTYRHGSERSESEAIADLLQPDLLILDEIGVQTGSEHEKMLVFELINERYQQCRATILISNLSPAELTTYLGDRLIDRFREGGGVIAFDWQSWRGRKAA